MNALDDPATQALDVLAAAMGVADADRVARSLQVFQGVMGALGARGLAESAEWLRANVARERGAGQPLRSEVCASWLAAVFEYLRAAPARREHAVAALMGITLRPEMLIKPTPNASARLRLQLLDSAFAPLGRDASGDTDGEGAEAALFESTEWLVDREFTHADPASVVEAACADLERAGVAALGLTDEDKARRKAAASGCASALAAALVRLAAGEHAPLAEACSAALPTLQAAAEREVEVVEPWLLLAIDLPTLLQSALRHPSDDANEALVTCLSDRAWTLAPTPDAVATMRRQLGLKPLRYRASEYLKALFDDPSASRPNLPVPQAPRVEVPPVEGRRTAAGMLSAREGPDNPAAEPTSKLRVQSAEPGPAEVPTHPSGGEPAQWPTQGPTHGQTAAAQAPAVALPIAATASVDEELPMAAGSGPGGVDLSIDAHLDVCLDVPVHGPLAAERESGRDAAAAAVLELDLSEGANGLQSIIEHARPSNPYAPSPAAAPDEPGTGLDRAFELAVRLADDDEAARRLAASGYAQALGQLAIRLAVGEFAPISDALSAILPTLHRAAEQGVSRLEPWLLPALDVPTLLQAVLNQPSQDAKEALLGCLQDPAWRPPPPSDEDVAALRSRLGLPPVTPEEREFVRSMWDNLDEEPVLPRTATPQTAATVPEAGAPSSSQNTPASSPPIAPPSAWSSDAPVAWASVQAGAPASEPTTELTTGSVSEPSTEPTAGSTSEPTTESTTEPTGTPASASSSDATSAPQNSLPNAPAAAAQPAVSARGGLLPFEPPATAEVDPLHLTMFETEFRAQLAEMRADFDDARVSQQAVEDSAGHFERLAMAAEAVGLRALAWLMRHLGGSLRDSAPRLSEAQHRWLVDMPARLRAYLAAPTDPSAAGALIEAVQEGGEFVACDAHTFAQLQLSLTDLRLVAGADEPRRPTRARAEDVSLRVPDDVSPDLLDGLLCELPVLSAEFSASMQRIAGGQGSMFDLDQARRAAHTLKGAANTVGVQGVAQLTHQVEDILSALAQHGRLPSSSLAACLMEAADCLEAMSEALAGTADAPANALRVLQRVLDWGNAIDERGIDADVQAEGLSSTDAAVAGTQAATAGAAVDTGLVGTTVAATDRQAAAFDGGGTTSATFAAAAAAVALRDQAAPAAAGGAMGAGDTPSAAEATLRVKARLIDELLHLVGETMIANTQIKEQLRQTQDWQRAVARQNAVLTQLAGEFEQLVDVRGVFSPARAARPVELDALEFDHYNELHTLSRRFIEATADNYELASAGDNRLATLTELIGHQGRIALDNRTVVMNTRMMPVAGIVPRLQRSVRQTARLLDKHIELHVSGESAAVDGSVLNTLLDPLMHLLRNACDHGIESAAVRRERGKPEVGRIDLAFLREGESLVVRCSDDGGGLDLARVRSAAERRGQLTAGQAMSDDELARLVLLPGFSTREEATQTSGRGVGLDAVYAKVQGLKGQLRLKNDPERGLTVELRVPISLMTSRGLLVRLGEQVVALSSQGIQDVLYVPAESLRALGARQVLYLGDKVIDHDRLDTLLGHEHREHDRAWFPALMVQTDAGTLRAVRVQEVLSSQEIVVKGLGRYVPRPPSVVGVTILGDGRIAPVIDLPTLLRSPMETAARRGAISGAPRSFIDARREALVIDDSLSARRATAQLMRDAGYEVRAAIDGMEAAALMEKRVPDIVLVDMEMPRMNGLEFTSHLRSRDATRHVPVIMITSRSADKHRKMAEAAGVDVYLTKPFNDDELLGHVERLLELTHA